MARLGKYSKDPDERKRYKIEYNDWLDSGETLLSVVFDVSPATAPALTVDGSDIAGDGLSVAYFVSGGAHGNIYDVTVTATTSGGQTKEDHVLYAVKNG